MRVAVLSSGGKDSAAAMWWAQCKGWDVVALVTVLVQGEDSHMFQIPTVDVVEHQANISGIPWIKVKTSGQSNEDMVDLYHALNLLEIDGLVCGALRSDYQRTRLERLCHELEIHSFTPLWHQNAGEHVEQMVQNGFKIIISGVACEGLGEDWLGKELDLFSFKELKSLSQKYRFNIDGEGGEYETLVVGGPHMNGVIDLEMDKVFDGKRGHIRIHKYTQKVHVP